MAQTLFPLEVIDHFGMLVAHVRAQSFDSNSCAVLVKKIKKSLENWFSTNSGHELSKSLNIEARSVLRVSLEIVRARNNNGPLTQLYQDLATHYVTLQNIFNILKEPVDRSDNLDDFLIGIAIKLGIPKEEISKEIAEWKQALGKYCRTKSKVEEYRRNGQFWASIMLDPSVKFEMEKAIDSANPNKTEDEPAKPASAPSPSSSNVSPSHVSHHRSNSKPEETSSESESQINSEQKTPVSAITPNEESSVSEDLSENSTEASKASPIVTTNSTESRPSSERKGPLLKPGSVIHLTSEEEFARTVAPRDRVIVIAISPSVSVNYNPVVATLEKLAQKYITATFAYIDFNQFRTKIRYISGTKVVPTFRFYKNRALIDQCGGPKCETQLKECIQKHIGDQLLNSESPKEQNANDNSSQENIDADQDNDSMPKLPSLPGKETETTTVNTPSVVRHLHSDLDYNLVMNVPDQLVIINITASGYPSRKMSHIFSELTKYFEGEKIIFTTINYQETKDTVQSMKTVYPLRCPIFRFYYNTEKLKEVAGPYPDILRDAFKEVVNTVKKERM